MASGTTTIEFENEELDALVVALGPVPTNYTPLGTAKLKIEQASEEEDDNHVNS